jgi:pimeloyl-ACP methyl ester carboxylesterase
MQLPVEHLSLQANGLRFYAAACGPPDGPLVLLLHGFPEMSYGWRHQLAPMAAAGLRVVAPDQRGYGHTDKPPGRSAYGLEALTDDVVAIARSLGRERFGLVGHDWGGIVAWHLASERPAHVERLAILNSPQLGVARAHAMRSPTQALRSAYVGFFQLPLLPEVVLGMADHALLAATLERSSRAGTFSEAEMQVYREAWSKPGALTSMLHWYRALPLARTDIAKRVSMPTLILWGDRDAALEAVLAEKCLALCDRAEAVHFPNASHWLQHEEPEQVNARLIGFFVGQR